MAYWEEPPLRKWKLREAKEDSAETSNANQEWDSRTLSCIHRGFLGIAVAAWWVVKPSLALPSAERLGKDTTEWEAGDRLETVALKDPSGWNTSNFIH